MEHSKISITARIVAYFRQFTDIPFAKDVADYVNAEQVFLNVLAKAGLSSGDLLESAPILEVRYKSIVSLVLKSGFKQVLELASGFSLRGLAMARDSDITYVESDLRELNDEKHNLIRKIRTEHTLPDLGNHHLAEANVLDLSELKKAVLMLRRDHPIAIVNEGLIQYLSPQEINTLAANVRSLLQEFGGGVWITPDFTTQNESQRISEKQKRFRDAISDVTDRRLYQGSFRTEEAMEGFFIDQGFASDCRYQLDEVAHLSALESLGLQHELLNGMRNRLRIWCLASS